MAPPTPSSPPAPQSPPPPVKHHRTGGSKASSSLSSRKSLDKTLPGIPGLPSGAASPSIVSTPSPAILYPPIPVPASGPIQPPPGSKTVQYPARPPNQLPPPVPTPPATAPPSAAPSRLTSLSSTNSKYAPSPLGSAPGAPSTTRQPSSSSTGQSSADEGSPDGSDKLRKRKKTSKKKANSEDMNVPPAAMPVRYPSMVLSRLVREEAESAANSNWMGVPPQRSSTVPANLGASRPASMILYRLADEEDRAWPTEGQLSRPASNYSLAPPPTNRFSSNRLSVSPSFDSKYPSFPVTAEGSPNTPPLALSGYATPPGSRPNSAYRNSSGTPPPGSTPLSQGVFLPYEYDPTEDEMGPNDSVDDLHHVVLELGSDGKYKFPKEPMADFNFRGVVNIICVALVISAILAVFLAYPVVDAVQRQQAADRAQQGAVISNPVGPKDGTSTTGDLLTSDDGILTQTDPFLTSPTRTQTQTTANPTPTTDENGDPIQTDPFPIPTPTPTPTPTPSDTLPIDPDTSLPIDPGTIDPGTLDPGTLRKRIAQPSAPVIAARRKLQARS